MYLAALEGETSIVSKALRPHPDGLPFGAAAKFTLVNSLTCFLAIIFLQISYKILTKLYKLL